ncbi:MAG: hypothetical protein GXX79_14775 [Actinomycetales bacterium]|nr:hypothetical protein [Actinomycetales bacterium]
MFDTVSGLPVHVLVVHAVVIGLPVMAVVTVAISLRPAWRRSAAVWVGLVNVLVLAAAFVAKESGERLQARLSRVTDQPVAQDHAELGALVPWFAVALLVAVVVVHLAGRRGGPLVPVAIGLSVVVALASIGWTVAVGHSGAVAVWQDVVTSTSAAGS